ncbi:helix-turn-helix domain-containing protein [Paenibacillus hexagrammi]|uniref:Helix-turn-helix domain-containing protein n=1 Tax=Paenibacillus hexagrammi TaxID=2908839 RepID=A0ABY3SKC7_9BACL|nr:helix-turn-helix transcriptional regulator [Paenibacillus sp. YPD9-1]UJF33928.1 helix-turn-helix domain-containing protein [Paenibacillus sp. YPD9-1]
MKTQEIVVKKVKVWLEAEGKSYQWLADELELSKGMVGHLLSGKRVLQPHYIEQIAKLMDIQLVDLLRDETLETGLLTVHLRGSISNRRSKRELDSLLFAIEDYIGLKDQVKG